MNFLNDGNFGTDLGRCPQLTGIPSAGVDETVTGKALYNLLVLVLAQKERTGLICLIASCSDGWISFGPVILTSFIEKKFAHLSVNPVNNGKIHLKI